MSHNLTLQQHKSYLANKIKQYRNIKFNMEALPEQIPQNCKDAIYTLSNYQDVQSCCDALHTLYTVCMDEIRLYGRYDLSSVILSAFDGIPDDYDDSGNDRVQLSLEHLFLLEKNN